MWLNKKHWTWLGLVAIVLALVLGLALGLTLGKRENHVASPRHGSNAYGATTYALVDDLNFRGYFFNNFDFQEGVDPSGGFAAYASRSEAQNLGLIGNSSGSVTMRVDNKTANATQGRASVRLNGVGLFLHGLYLFEVLHFPVGCGVSASIGTYNPTHYPQYGGIDIVNAVNNATSGNQVALHTGGNTSCVMPSNNRSMSGTATSNNCSDANSGCSVTGLDFTAGAQVSDTGGGVYVMQWQPQAILVWYFPSRLMPPGLLTSEMLDTSDWSSKYALATASFPSTSCNISDHFASQRLRISLNLCSNRSSSRDEYTDKAKCPGDCRSFVANNPSAYDEAYWRFGTVRQFRTI